jgi:hypothetical protein
MLRGVEHMPGARLADALDPGRFLLRELRRL